MEVKAYNELVGGMNKKRVKDVRWCGRGRALQLGLALGVVVFVGIGAAVVVRLLSNGRERGRRFLRRLGEFLRERRRAGEFQFGRGLPDWDFEILGQEAVLESNKQARKRITNKVLTGAGSSGMSLYSEGGSGTRLTSCWTRPARARMSSGGDLPCNCWKR